MGKNGASPDRNGDNRDELGRFPKGVSGNPRGRPPKNREFTRALEETVDKKQLAEVLWGLALQGDMQAIKYIYDRIEGTPTQRHEFSADDFARKLREERPELDDEKVTFISQRAREIAEATG